MRSLKFALMVALAIIIAASAKAPCTPANALFPTFNVPVLLNPVTINGVITGDEWADANRKDVTFIRDAIEYDGTIYLKHDCTDLYMCIQVLDDDEEPYPSPGDTADYVGVVFDTNGDITINVGDDIKHVIHDDYDADLAIKSPLPAPPEMDAIENVNGESEWEAGVYTFELVLPLNSGDSLGNDIAISPGDEIRATFTYNDPDEIPEAPPYVDFILSLEPCPAPVGGTIIQTDKMGLLTPVLASLTAAVAVSTAIITYRRRKTQTS